MKKKAFTLIEMLFVMMIISILLLLITPNLLKKQKIIKAKSCDALLEMVQGQVLMYELQNGLLPDTLDELIEAELINEKHTTCPTGQPIRLRDGQVYV